MTQAEFAQCPPQPLRSGQAIDVKARSAREFHRVWSPRGPWAEPSGWKRRQLGSCCIARPDPAGERAQGL